MPCFTDTIVKIKFSKQNVKKESGLISVWAVRTYPVGNEDCVIELVLFVRIYSKERDLDTQAIFDVKIESNIKESSDAFINKYQYEVLSDDSCLSKHEKAEK
ncbi:2310_t:CDS:2 [Cetraspora pellucida]|uniref:2310_t:CDS:1 n=1 Tax=Cetraspora pellucida TaxID=1433469 RepID=A0ACA9M128_9GLOM|nr:2310_t:CDS:2 [Cetraspora pellucida]